MERLAVELGVSGAGRVHDAAGSSAAARHPLDRRHQQPPARLRGLAADHARPVAAHHSSGAARPASWSPGQTSSGRRTSLDAEPMRFYLPGRRGLPCDAAPASGAELRTLFDAGAPGVPVRLMRARRAATPAGCCHALNWASRRHAGAAVRRRRLWLTGTQSGLDAAARQRARWQNHSGARCGSGARATGCSGRLDVD